jgi:hypothetical protein
MTWTDFGVLTTASLIGLTVLTATFAGRRPVHTPVSTVALCQIGHSDGLLVRERDGSLTAYIFVDGELRQEEEFVPCRRLRRAGRA